MKKLLLYILLGYGTHVYAQLQVNITGTYIENGALGFNISIFNPSTTATTITIEDGNTFRQQYKDTANEQSAYTSVASYVCFYHKKRVMNEPVTCLNQSLPKAVNIVLPAGGTQVLKYEIRCLSDGVLSQLNSGKPLNAEIHLVYECNKELLEVKSTLYTLKIKR